MTHRVSDVPSPANEIAPGSGVGGALPSVTGQGGRLQSLDVVRGVAVLLVLGRHITHEPALIEPFQSITGYWFQCGWVGVDLFFVLSGFLVSGLVFEEWKRTGRFAAGRFLIRRGFKIYPAFYLLWLVVFCQQWYSGHGFDVARLMDEALFIQNYFPAEWHHTWSLAVEEHFYFGLALIMWLRVRSHRGPGNPFLPVVWLGLAILIGCVAMRWQASTDGKFDLYRNYTPTHIRMDTLMAGVILSWFWSFKRDLLEKLCRGRWKMLLVGGIALLSPTLFLRFGVDLWMQVTGFSVFAMGGVLLILAALFAPPGRHNPVSWAVARIGFYSYSIYLWNLPFERFLDSRMAGWFTRNTWLLVYLAGSIAIGIVLGKLVEWPALRLRDRWFPKAGSSVRRFTPIKVPESAAV